MKAKKLLKSDTKAAAKVQIGSVINELTLNLREYLTALQAVSTKKAIPEK